MTHTNSSTLADLINQARTGQYIYSYPEESLVRQSAASLWHRDWRCMLNALFAEWPETTSEIRGVSFIFTDAPFELSRLVFDAAVIWDGNVFRRVELADMPAAFRTTLEMFEESVQLAILSLVGDALAKMTEQYAHQLHAGQGYLSLDTLTVMNIQGKNTSRRKALTPSLPYAVTALLTGTGPEIAARSPESGMPCGSLWFADWTTEKWNQSRVSVKHLKASFQNTCCPVFDNPEALRKFRQAAQAMHIQARLEGCGAR